MMQPAAPELLAALCPPHAEVEVYNEKERDVPLDRDWDLVLFSYLDPFYDHTRVLSELFRRRGMTTVAGGRHARQFPHQCGRWFDAVVTGDVVHAGRHVAEASSESSMEKHHDGVPERIW